MVMTTYYIVGTIGGIVAIVIGILALIERALVPGPPQTALKGLIIVLAFPVGVAIAAIILNLISSIAPHQVMRCIIGANACEYPYVFYIVAWILLIAFTLASGMLSSLYAWRFLR